MACYKITIELHCIRLSKIDAIFDMLYNSNLDLNETISFQCFELEFGIMKNTNAWKMLEIWFEMTLNYLMKVDLYPNLKQEVGGSIPNYEIFSLLNKKKLARWSIASCAINIGLYTFLCQKRRRKIEGRLI